METIESALRLADRVDRLRAAGERVALVPTMGALHEGHLALVDRARAIADRVVVSIFVNPTQFDDPADLERYPRDPERDARLLELRGCDLLFLPRVDAVYPEGHATRIEIAGPALGLEGEMRSGHFAGVATIVAKLLLLVRPDCAVFGEKDAQQLAVVRRLVEDLHLPVEIIGHPTVREPDGLAMSSRNARLAPEERRAATVLYRALRSAVEQIASGERSADTLRAHMKQIVESEPRARLEYAEVVDAATFQSVARVEGDLVLPIAAYVGAVRLIDNLSIQVTDTDRVDLDEVLGASTEPSHHLLEA